MKITAATLLVPILLLVKQDPSTAQEEEHSIRGLKSPPAPAPYKVTFDQALTNPGVYYATGNNVGDPNTWTVGISSTNNVNGRKLKIGLRGKKRYQPEYPQFIPHDDYYIFNVGTGFKQDGTTPTGLPEWNFDYEFDSDVDCPSSSTTCTPLATYAYEVAMDVDPTIKTRWITVDPINVPIADHDFGKFDTVQATKYKAATSGDYYTAITGGKWHVVQNSFNYGFLGGIPPLFYAGFVGFNPLVYTEGIYDVAFSIKNKATGQVLVKTSIRFLVKDPAKCTIRGKCFPTVAADCNKSNIGKFNMFFTNKDTKACEDFVKGIKQ
jgi:hypothetical protein